MKLTGENRSNRGKTCPSATLSNTNPTETDQGSNPGFRGGRPATNRLNHGRAQSSVYKNGEEFLSLPSHSRTFTSRRVLTHCNYINLFTANEFSSVLVC
jgi:hypothetical protein